MAIQRTHAHLSIIIDGHRFVSFADEDQPYEFEWPVLRDGTTGADGAHYSRAIADFGCMLTIRLSDISPSLQWAIQRRQEYLNAVRQGRTIPIHSGSIADLSFGISGTMGGMSIDDTFPGWPGAASSTNEIKFDVELWTPNVEGGAFQAPLTASAT